MADISKIKINNVEYDIKDAQARSSITNMYSRVETKVVQVEHLNGPSTGHADISYNVEGLTITNGNYTVKLPVLMNGEVAMKEKSFGKVWYDRSRMRIYFLTDDTEFDNDGVPISPGTGHTIAILDATPFVKDAMVSNVAITGGNLVITWNSDAGIQPTSIPLTDIFNPANYYNKDEIDQIVAGVEAGQVGIVDNLTTDDATKALSAKQGKVLQDNKANKNEMTVTDVTGDATKKNIQLKSGTSQNVVVEHQDISGKANKSEMSVSKGTGTNAGKTTITLTSETGKSATLLDSTHPAASITDANKTAWNNKQSAINDLDTIRSGAAKGATSVQTISVNEGTPMQPTNGNVDITIPSAAWADVKPSGGVPKGDLASGVQTSLGKADSAIQGVKVNGTELTPDADKKVDVTVPTKLSDLSADATHRLVTDTEKSTWNSKQNALTFDNTPTKSSANPVKSGGVYSALADLYDGYDSTTETLSFTFPTE